MNFTPAPECSPKVRNALHELWRSDTSEGKAVAECLNDIASNGDEQATDACFLTCAEEIRDWANTFIDKIRERKPFGIHVRWGDENSQREIYDTPRDAAYYGFASEAELAAFLLALNEHEGWLDCDAFSDEELAQEPEQYPDDTDEGDQ